MKKKNPYTIHMRMILEHDNWSARYNDLVFLWRVLSSNGQIASSRFFAVRGTQIIPRIKSLGSLNNIQKVKYSGTNARYGFPFASSTYMKPFRI